MNIFKIFQHFFRFLHPAKCSQSNSKTAKDIKDSQSRLNYFCRVFEYLCETAHLHLVHCIHRLMSLKATPKAHASWTDTDITWLISFLYKHQAEGTDGGFKKSTYIAAAEDLAPHHHKGGEKNWESCKQQ